MERERAVRINAAEAALEFAPPWWSKQVEGQMRKRLWDALRIDDAGQLAKALRVYTTECTHVSGGWNLEKLLVRLRVAMWSKSAGKGASGKRRGLLHIAASNVAGVPHDGAVRCLARLLEMSPPDPTEYWQIQTAVAECERLGRVECLALLRPALDSVQSATRTG